MGVCVAVMFHSRRAFKRFSSLKGAELDDIQSLLALKNSLDSLVFLAHFPCVPVDKGGDLRRTVRAQLTVSRSLVRANGG